MWSDQNTGNIPNKDWPRNLSRLQQYIYDIWEVLMLEYIHADHKRHYQQLSMPAGARWLLLVFRFGFYCQTKSMLKAICTKQPPGIAAVWFELNWRKIKSHWKLLSISVVKVFADLRSMQTNWICMRLEVEHERVNPSPAYQCNPFVPNFHTNASSQSLCKAQQ